MARYACTRRRTQEAATGSKPQHKVESGHLRVIVPIARLVVITGEKASAAGGLAAGGAPGLGRQELEGEALAQACDL